MSLRRRGRCIERWPIRRLPASAPSCERASASAPALQGNDRLNRDCRLRGLRSTRCAAPTDAQPGPSECPLLTDDPRLRIDRSHRLLAAPDPPPALERAPQEWDGPPPRLRAEQAQDPAPPLLLGEVAVDT